MSEVISFEENIPHRVEELICINCKNRWINVSPVGLLLKKMICPYCEQEGFVINTGEYMDEDD